MYSPLHHINENLTWTPAELSAIKAKTLTPSIVYLSFIMLIGVFGNACVLIIFYFRFSASTHRCFILVLASYDLFACAVGAPFTIAESFFAYNYLERVSCKIFRFILYYTCIASSLTLVLIAIERHRKICTPLKTQFTVVMAKKALFVVAGVISFISASPAFVLYGHSTVYTGVPNVNGTKCFIEDYYDIHNPIYPLAFNIYLLALAFLSTLIMSVCYIRIARQVSRMGNVNVGKRNRNPAAGNVQNEDTSCTNDMLSDDNDTTSVGKSRDAISVNKTPKSPKPNHNKDVLRNIPSSVSMSSNGKDQKVFARQSSVQSSNSLSNIKRTVYERTSLWASKLIRRLSTTHGRKTIRITKMLTVVTVAFVISYLPHLSLMIWSLFITRDNQHTLPTDNKYQIIFYSFLINNLVNPFIYAAMDLKFRTELKKLLKCQMSLVKSNTLKPR